MARIDGQTVEAEPVEASEPVPGRCQMRLCWCGQCNWLPGWLQGLATSMQRCRSHTRLPNELRFRLHCSRSALITALVRLPSPFPLPSHVPAFASLSSALSPNCDGPVRAGLFTGSPWASSPAPHSLPWHACSYKRERVSSAFLARATVRLQLCCALCWRLDAVVDAGSAVDPVWQLVCFLYRTTLISVFFCFFFFWFVLLCRI